VATYTERFNLRKPTASDHVNVALDIAGNMDLLDAHAHSGTYVPVGSNGAAVTDPYAHGARGDYTGRLSSAGTGTDNRAAIQAALDAASNVSGSSYYDYLTRRSVTVRLAAGHYLISAPSDGSPSLVVPPGVTFDCSDATLYFNYPASTTKQWCGVKIEQYGQIHVGKLYTSSVNSAPSSDYQYDAIRMVATDNLSRVVGYGDSEIQGFRGAGVRLIGAWLPYLRGLRITGCRFGVVAGHFGDAFTTYTDSGGAQPFGLRFTTDTVIDDCLIVNCPGGGVRFGAAHTGSDINAVDYGGAGGSVAMRNTILENVGYYALWVTQASAVDIDACHIEEAGHSDGIVFLDTIRVVTVRNLQFNLEGRTITKADGTTGGVLPSAFFKTANVQSFDVEGLYSHNSYQPSLAFVNTAPAHYRIGGIYTDDEGFTGGGIAVANGHEFHSGQYNKRHLVLNATHLWADGNNVLRTKASAPSSAIDGRATLPDYDFPMTADPRLITSTNPTVGAANRGMYLRTLHGGTISKVGLNISTSSGNICVAVFAAAGSGAAAVPTTRLATSGSVASPGTGYREISLGGSVYVPAGSFIYIGADNNTVAFAGQIGVSGMSAGLSYFEETFPAPATAGTISASGRLFAAVGVA